jgi:hypothetical protein
MVALGGEGEFAEVVQLKGNETGRRRLVTYSPGG